MNVGQLMEQVLYYFESASDLTEAVIVRAINAARRAAEIQFAFEMNKKVLQASVDARLGVVWTSMAQLGTTSPLLPVRSLKRAYFVSDDGLGFTEVKFDYKGLLKFNAQDPMQSVTLGLSHDFRLYIVGDTLYIYPFGTQGTFRSLAFDAYVWMPDYLITDLGWTDWMLDNHAQYLFWQAAWDLNYKKKEWVPRQEGNLQLARDTAQGELQRMFVWDSSIRSYQTSLNELM
jgi:hypothetical protein